MTEFEGKVVLVTGAGRGIGRAVSLAFARQGARLAVNDLTPVNLDTTVDQVVGTGAQAVGFTADVSRKPQIQQMVEEVRAAFGRIDVLVNNAAVAPRAPLLTMDEWDWDRTLGVNLKGPFLLIQSVGRVMADEGGGVILNVASAQAKGGVLPDRGGYLASKAGLLALTRQAAVEMAAYNVRVNAICPGDFLAAAGDSSGLTADASLLAGSPALGPIANAALYLCSMRAEFVTGECLVVGGRPSTRSLSRPPGGL
jgi:NAD(P)-dependent dehydrogenase (short-subunit alcohol dehydrogenase family)